VSEPASAFFYALLLAAISGFTAFAYRHPKAYARMFAGLFLVASVTFLVLQTWNLGVWVAHLQLEPFIPVDRRPDALRARHAIELDWMWLTIVQLGTIGYLISLDTLLAMVRDDPPARR
jgi:hypothetical protein